MALPGGKTGTMVANIRGTVRLPSGASFNQAAVGIDDGSDQRAFSRMLRERIAQVEASSWCLQSWTIHNRAQKSSSDEA